MQPVAGSDIQAVFREYTSLDHERETNGIPCDEQGRWAELKRKLSVHFQPDLESRHEDRRGSIRVLTRVEFCYESRGPVGESLMTNSTSTRQASFALSGRRRLQLRPAREPGDTLPE